MLKSVIKRFTKMTTADNAVDLGLVCPLVHPRSRARAGRRYREGNPTTNGCPPELTRIRGFRRDPLGENTAARCTFQVPARVFKQAG